MSLGQVEGGRFFVEVGAIEVLLRHIGEWLPGLLTQSVGQRVGGGGKVLKAKALRMAITLYAAGRVEQAGLTAQA